MNRITRRMLSGGLVAGLSLLATAAHAQARSGAWTRNAPDGDWQMAGRDFSLQRFSPLAQVSTSNVATLKAAWTFSTGTLRGHEGQPLVVNKTMYLVTPYPNVSYAIDLTQARRLRRLASAMCVSLSAKMCAAVSCCPPAWTRLINISPQ